MKLGFMYLPVAALLYNSFAICSDTYWQEDDEYMRLAIQLSTEESDHQLAKKLSSQLNTDLDINGIVSEMSEEQQFAEAIRLSLEETKTDHLNSKPTVEEKLEVTDGDIHILGKIFKELKTEYDKAMTQLEILCAEDPSLIQRPPLNEHALANMDATAVQDILNKQNEDRKNILKEMAKAQDILEPKDQKDTMITLFKEKTKCSKAFAEKAYKKFIGED
jgi:hypothetical protein